MYIHDAALIKNVLEPDFIDHVRARIIKSDSVSFEVLSENNLPIYNTNSCTAANFITFTNEVSKKICVDGVCIAVETIIDNGKFFDTVYIVNGE